MIASSMKGKAGKGRWSSNGKLGLPSVFLLCAFFFLAGHFASDLLSQRIYVARSRLRPRQLQLVEDRRTEYELLPHGETGDDSLTMIPFQILSWKPRALYFPNFATAEQCQSIINLAKPKLKPSKLFLRKGETEENTRGVRTSTGTFIGASEDKSGVLDAIEGKISRATMLPKTHGEDFNVLCYKIGQMYKSHYDAFSPAEYGPQKSQRFASFLLYLSDVEEGGETMFPWEQNGSAIDWNYDFEQCIGLKVKPRRGDGLLFYSMFPNITIDPLSLHGSCPVIRGEKWVATKWIRDQELNDYY